MKFEEESIKKEIKNALKNMNITVATEIQEKCIPLIMQGKDIVGQSLTGSGKTAAFVIPLVEKNVKGQTNVLVLTPTRELAQQVSDTFSNISTFLDLNICTVYGGVDIRPQINNLRIADIVIATPGRLLDHIERKTINLNNIQTLVLDEADQMFDMGFIHDIEKIITRLPKKKQILLFSATFSPKINSLIKKHLTNPVFIKAQEFVDESKLTQIYYEVSMERRFSLLAHLLKNDDKDLSIVFCNKRYEVDKVKNNLKKQGVKGVAIHGGLTQSKRQQALKVLKKEHANVLVATDVAARGLDISGVSHVYNFGIPKTAEEYTHRIGRTARMGRKGLAITLVTERDRKEFSYILKEHKILKHDTPEFEQIKFEKNLPNDDYFENDDSNQRSRRRFGNRFNNRNFSQSRGPRRPRRNESSRTRDSFNKNFNRSNDNDSQEFDTFNSRFSKPRDFKRPQKSFDRDSRKNRSFGNSNQENWGPKNSNFRSGQNDEFKKSFKPKNKFNARKDSSKNKFFRKTKQFRKKSSF